MEERENLPYLLKYANGERVTVGDVVRLPMGEVGVVEQVILPGTIASAGYKCDQGGVLVCEPVVYGYVLIECGTGATGDNGWADLRLIRRNGTDA